MEFCKKGRNNLSEQGMGSSIYFLVSNEWLRKHFQQRPSSFPFRCKIRELMDPIPQWKQHWLGWDAASTEHAKNSNFVIKNIENLQTKTTYPISVSWERSTPPNF